MAFPKAIVILSGKRKSGKDYFGEILARRLGNENCELVRLSGPLKKQYSEIHGLEFSRLQDSSSYKETYRLDMVKWGEAQRIKDPEIFCRLASQHCTRLVWVVTDARRPSDLKYFSDHYPGKVILIRIQCPQDVRQNRGWVFKIGVDDSDSECALDEGVAWDMIVDNSHDISRSDIDSVCNLINNKTS